MDTFEKETDLLIKKSVMHKKDFVPDSYRKRLMDTLESLPDKAETKKVTEDADVEVIDRKRKIEFRAIVSAAAAVLLFFGGYSVLSGIVKPGSKPDVTDASAVIKTEETTESSVSETKISALINNSSETTVTEVTTEETQSQTDNSEEENINNQVAFTQSPDPGVHNPGAEVLDANQKTPHEEPDKPKAEPDKPKSDEKGPKVNDREPKAEHDGPKSDIKNPKADARGEKGEPGAPKEAVNDPKP